MAIQKNQQTEFDAFTCVVDKILSVPKTAILRREEAYRKQADKNPHKRGPRRKTVK